MPPNDRPVASIRRPRFDPAALEAVGARWEDRSHMVAAETVAHAEPTRTSSHSDVQTSHQPEIVTPPANRPVLVSREVVESASPTAAATMGATPSASPNSRSLVERVGRPLGNGSRKGARTLRRMTVYLQPERASQLAVRCAQTGENMSDVIERALATYLAD